VGDSRRTRGPARDPAAAQALREACERVVAASLRLGRLEASEEGVSLPQALMLLDLSEVASMSIARLIERSGKAPATVGGILEGLASAGYVHRERGVEDRREVWVTLTPAGRELVLRLVARRARLWSPLERRFRRKDVAAVAQLLDEVSTEMDAMRQGAGEPDPDAPIRAAQGLALAEGLK
jgi:DNA-binding MarR family transcriptional regulator